jgi:subtilisin family serine protease
MTQSHPPARPSAWIVVLTTTLMLAGMPTAGTASATNKIDPDLLGWVERGETATFWAILGTEANLSSALGILDRDARGQFVVDELARVAHDSQAGLVGWLSARTVLYQAFWIVNAVRITAGPDVMLAVAGRPEVARVRAATSYRLPLPSQSRPAELARGVEWGIERIRADEVWDVFGSRGQGITVANVDTGVLWTHPALRRAYRGSHGGSVDHNYNWWDPSEVCGSPSLEPCDNNGHGTHTMGTLVGQDRNGNQIGVAPRARWIAAKGCELDLCSDFSILSSGQWILAPTDLSGDNPKVHIRPHIVNNSWGDSDGSNIFFRGVVRAWRASGIFPVFSSGSGGPTCRSVESPASFRESYGVGAFDQNNVIAIFSARGPSPFGETIKPDVAAPGVNVRSSWNDGGYEFLSGTSMAAPHVAGTVALMWSAAPALARDVDGTIAFIDDTAIDTSGSCGGTLDDNNAWGQGRLDAYAAVEAVIGAVISRPA